MYKSNVGMYMQDLESNHPHVEDDARLAKACREAKLERTRYYRFDMEGRWFGFKDLDQLRSWIYKEVWREALDKEGYVVSMIKPVKGSLLVGDTQCVFHIEDVICQLSWKEVSK